MKKMQKQLPVREKSAVTRVSTLQKYNGAVDDCLPKIAEGYQISMIIHEMEYGFLQKETEAAKNDRDRALPGIPEKFKGMKLITKRH